MRESLRKKCDIFIDNKEKMKKDLKWENSALQVLCAYIFLKENKKFDNAKIKRCKKIIRENTSFFSQFKSGIFISMVAMLSLEEDDLEKKFKDVVEAYNTVLYRFEESIYIPLVSFFMSKYANTQVEYEKIVLKSRVIYKTLRYEEKILNKDVDTGLILLYGISDFTHDFIIEEMEICYRMLRKYFKNEALTAAISQVIAFGDKDYTLKCENILNVVKQLKEKNATFSSAQELEVLGWLVLLNDDVDDIVDDIIEVNNYIKVKAGFRFLASKELRQIYAAMIVGEDYIEKNRENGKRDLNRELLEEKIPYFITQQVSIKNIVEKKKDLEE